MATHLVDRPARDDLAALRSRARAEVDQVFGGLEDVGVVLDDDDRISAVAHLPKDLEQSVVVPRVEADRGLVEHEERVDERRAERRREVDPLDLAARERARLPIERQVAETDRVEVRQSRRELLDDEPHGTR